jgi:fatty acid desaturase
VKDHYYSQHAGALRAELGAAISREEMRALHRKQPSRHFAVAIRQFAVLALATWALIRFDNPLVWIPLTLVQGFTVFNFTILLHEVVHHTIFERRRPRLERLLDCSPALFPIYFRAAKRESSTYPEPLRRAIGRERKLSMVFHLSALGLIWYGFGFYAAARASIIPVFFIFPIAFTLNRLGQHYDIDPTDPAKWGTLMKGHWFWDFAFLNSNYHLEHHYFPGVPFYRLPEVQRALVPFYERKKMRWRTYGELVHGWLIENHAPHTDWSKPAAGRHSGVAAEIHFP